MSMFSKAVRKKSKLRLALIGPSGSGKSLSALLIARGIGGRVAVLDSERGSASLYAGAAGEFDVCELEDFAPQTYTTAIRAAEREGYDVIIIDSLSHAWSGKGGALEMKDAATKRSRSGNSFDAWREVTPHHNALVDAMVSSKCHVIVTMRSKTEYVLEENERGKKVPRKVGMAPVQRDGLEYEFTLVGEMDYEHNFIVSKSRCFMADGSNKFDNAVISKPDGEFALALMDWMNNGVEVAHANPTGSSMTATTSETHQTGGATPTSSTSRTRSTTTSATSDRDAAVAMAAGHGFVEDPSCNPFVQDPNAHPEAEDLLTRLLPIVNSEADLVDLAARLVELTGKPSAASHWRRFADFCADKEVPWRVMVARAMSGKRGAA